MSLLSIIENVAAAVNTTIPTSIFGNSNADARQWLALANRCGKEVLSRHDWQMLVIENTWTTTATEEQLTAMPADFDRFVADVAVWDRTNNTKLTGPISSAEWQQLQGSAITGGSPGWWRLIGGEMHIYPAPDAGLTFAFEYVSNDWITLNAGGTSSVWQADTDQARGMPPFERFEELIELCLTWRWLRAHGMDYAEELATYEREIEKAAARDRGLRVEVLERRGGDRYSWPGTITP